MSEMKSTTTKIPTGYGNLYVTIAEDESSKPISVFCTVGKSGNAIMAKAEIIGRLISLALKYSVPLKEIIKQLDGIGSNEGSVPWNDTYIKSIPDAIAKVLNKKYMEE